MFLLCFSFPASRLSSFFSLVSLSCLGVILSLPASGQGAKPIKNTYYSLDGTTEPVALFISPKKTVIVTTGGIYQQEGKEFLKKYTATGVINCALEDDSVFWLGTQTGLVRVNKKSFKSTAVALPVNDDQPRVTTILKDYAGTIGVGAEAHGVYQFRNNTFEKVLGVFPVNAGATTPDSSVWIGTNTGLYRWKNMQWVRYNEEGVTNFEIPDNIVHKLKVDNNSNLWAILSEGVTVFEAKSPSPAHEQHVPSVKFIGKPQNAIYSVIHLKQQGYVFATAMGVLFLPDGNRQLPQLTHLEESATSDVVADKQLLYKIQMPAGSSPGAFNSYPFLLHQDKKKNIWFINKQGISVFTQKNFAKLLSSKD